jgi:hypothetical protein
MFDRYNYEYDYIYDWITLNETKDKEKDDKIQKEGINKNKFIKIIDIAIVPSNSQK